MTDHSTRTSTSNSTADSSYARGLRDRAEHLAELARSIERSLVMHLADAPSVTPRDRRTQLCHALLERNLHQLHRAADDLRVTAMRFRTRADELDAAFRVAA